VQKNIKFGWNKGGVRQSDDFWHLGRRISEVKQMEPQLVQIWPFE